MSYDSNESLQMEKFLVIPIVAEFAGLNNDNKADYLKLASGLSALPSDAADNPSLRLRYKHEERHHQPDHCFFSCSGRTIRSHGRPVRSPSRLSSELARSSAEAELPQSIRLLCCDVIIIVHFSPRVRTEEFGFFSRAYSGHNSQGFFRRV